MNLQEIERLIEVFEKSKLSAMDLENSEFKIRLEKEGATKKANVVLAEEKTESKSVEEEATGNFVKSPLVGTFHQAPYPNADPFVTVGAVVKKGDKLCIIEAMKVMSEIKSPYDGVIKKIFVENGKMVEYDQKLFEIGDTNV